MYLQNIEITNFSCVRSAKLDLTPLHALIGPNDSGKSTLLRAVRLLTQYLAVMVQPPPPSIDIDKQSSAVVGARLKAQLGGLTLDISQLPGPSVKVNAKHEDAPAEVFPSVPNNSSLHGILVGKNTTIASMQDPHLGSRATKTAVLLRLDPDELRKDSELIPENDIVTFSENQGKGMRGNRLPGIYDAIMNRGDDSFSRIAKDIRQLFPTVRNVRLRAVSNSQKGLEVELLDGTRVPASQMSEGLLYFLAYAALPYLASPSILLVEEPENGLHPARIRDVMAILREISKTTQVLIATHSPLVVNELSGDEVTVVTRHPEHGTQTRRLSSTPDFNVRSKVYLPGELWLNYANGIDEADLLADKKAAT